MLRDQMTIIYCGTDRYAELISLRIYRHSTELTYYFTFGTRLYISIPRDLQRSVGLHGDAESGTPKTVELQRQKNSNDNRTPIF
jgi:hypothetical protein